MVTSGRVIRLMSERLANPFRGKIVTPCFVSEQADVVQRFRVVWLRGEDLPVERFGFDESAGLVVLERQGECLVDRHWVGMDCFSHQCRHIVRQANSKWHAKPGESIKGEVCIRCRSVRRSSASRGRSAPADTSL